LTGARVNAEAAYLIGLVSQVTEDEQTIPTAIQLAQSLAKMPPIALQQIKDVALMSEEVPLTAGLTLERNAFQGLFSTEDKNEGVQ
ncbi:enoyl-CoA hydratase-related protein, partial [Acinetobacter baumannii]|uniref:enoyl-CoA hydratase-related protein n=1 Tax=Acinetobacter baumannii TaxID=470 RepID=UPI003AF8E73F